MRTIATAIALVLTGLTTLGAQSFSGSLELGAGAWLGSDELLALGTSFEGSIEGKIGDPEQPSGRFAASVMSSFASGATSVSLRDAWFLAYLGPFDLTLGNQLVTWGATDVFTPVDVVNPQDLTLPVAAEKLHVPAARLLLNGNGFSLDLVAVPFWQASVLPATRWQIAPANPAGLVIDSQTVADLHPKLSWESMQFGGHLKGTLDWQQGFDLGVTYYQGVNTTPTATPVVTPVSPGHATVLVTKEYDPYRLAGVEAVLALEGGLLIKSEGNYKWRPNTATAQGVLGLEYTLATVKTLAEVAVDWSQAEAAGVDSWVTTLLLVATADPDPRVNVKAVGAWNLDGSGLVSPQITYTIADGLKAELQGFVFLGAEGTRYGDWVDNALATARAVYSF